jgi:hypothetical protein
MTSSQPPEWMVVYITYNFLEAQIVAGRLESEGIQALVHQEAGANAIGIRIGRMGEVKVLVRPNDFDTAESILYPDESPTLTDDADRIIFDDDDADE